MDCWCTVGGYIAAKRTENGIGGVSTVKVTSGGMTAGVVAAIVMKFTVPDAWVLYFFPVLFGVSLIGCIIGTYSAPATDEETLINFYVNVRRGDGGNRFRRKQSPATRIFRRIKTSKGMPSMWR